MRALDVDVLGAAVRLSLPDHLAAELRAALTDLDRPAPGTPTREIALQPVPDGGLRLVDDGEEVLPHVAPELAVATLVWRLNAIAAADVAHVVLHAGCVATSGGGIALPGASGAGKSTLTAAAVAAGFAYLTDEHASLSLRTGMLTPFPKPLDLGARGLVPASDLRPGSLGEACAPAALVFPRFAAGSDTIRTPLDPPTSLLALCAQATNLPEVGGAGFAALAGLAEAVPAWQVTYGATGGGLDTVRHAADAAGGPARPVVPVPVAEPVTPTTVTVVVGGDTVVVLDTTTWAVHRFNASAGLVWLCAAVTQERDALVELVRSEAPPGAIDPDHVGAAVDHLRSIGLLGGPGVADPR